MTNKRLFEPKLACRPLARWFPNELRKCGLSISPAGIRGVWQRYDLETMKEKAQGAGSKSLAGGSDFDRGAGHSLGEG
jgi:hypothetical protein